ncbi:MAG: ATP-dependent DNA helicase [Acidobacteria bacterium]|nr:MAG: ATP-dependent DNA helicase [Acidobacteriota bacterium]REK02099.1 MAG: ATP-dependent DNA helicase [Acidobacteriota bacterium]REK15057.1 MAG: ATP-dependent DNA helicase [Acidobacteriota bacterium]REK45771.1 MAG: ATP-dependent DNA helicase [Acidobacteriota bacterium]
MEDIFGSKGLLAEHHEAFEDRPGQLKMAQAVLKAFEDKRHLIVEAGTGTGKTLAYLVPAVAFAKNAKRRVVISTGTKNLQEQLMEKDLPFLHNILPGGFTSAYMKGRANYACLYRIKKADDQPVLSGLDEIRHFDKVRDWAFESETGDRAELTDLPEDLGFWPRINARSETCLGQQCPDFEPCFITRMRDRAEKADVIIVNHHLFFADLNLRGNEYGKVIPDYGAVIFDEAHLIEDIASDYFGIAVSSFQIEELARDTEAVPIPEAAPVAQLKKVLTRVRSYSDMFWSRFTQGRGREGRYPLERGLIARRSTSGEEVPTRLGEAYAALDRALSRLQSSLDVHSDSVPEAESVVRRIRQCRSDLEFIVGQKEENYVYWIERRGRGTFVRAAPVDVSGILQDRLFEKVDTCVLTSATLSTNGTFDFIRGRLGLESPKTDTLIAPSSFDYREQAIIYLPKTMPEPRSPEFTQLAAGEIMKLLGITEGRTFVLSTSFSSMNALHEIVSSRVDYPCFLQGTMSKTGILERFRETPNAVLFGTSSFWQGVDVRGEQLSCVIIDKLPFAVPTDPLVAARTRYIDEHGGRSFFEYSVPSAVITLKQGIGRLIRSTTDHGIIALLDPRLRTKGYGRDFLKSLPDARITTELSEVESHFKSHTPIAGIGNKAGKLP